VRGEGFDRSFFVVRVCQIGKRRKMKSEEFHRGGKSRDHRVRPLIAAGRREGGRSERKEEKMKKRRKVEVVCRE
jgi:hypothetical protein